jgi:hypothetical protein
MVRIGVLIAAIISLSRINLDAQITSINIEECNLSGGGFQSDVTITDDGMTIYSSADVSGIFKSTDGGLTYYNINEGLKSPKVASLVITPDNDQILYAGTGDKGGSGGLFRSIDGGDTWELPVDGDAAQFAGNHSATSDPIPNGHPRSNGDLIIVDPGSQQGTYTDDIVIAGTYKNGVKIFTSGGDVEASIVNGNGFVRSVAFDPSIPNTAYAAIYFNTASLNGIYEIDYSNPNAATSTLVYATPSPEGLAVLGSGHVYAAIGPEGIVKYNGNSWFLVNTGLDTGNNLRYWSAVTGYVRNNSDIVYAGVNNLGGNASGSNYSSIWRSTNGGNSWIALVDVNSNVSDQIYGQSHDWWFRTQGFPQAGLGRKNSVVSSIDVALGNFPQFVSDDIIYVSGRGGIWKSADGGSNWNPAVHNMQATANTDVAVNDDDPDQIAIANTDYVLLETSNAFNGSNISRDKPSGSESRGYDVIFDEVSDDIILGTGDRDNNSGGEVFIKSSNALGSPSDSGWTDTNLDALVNARVTAVAYGYHNGNAGTTQTILASVEGEHVYRYHNNSWSNTGLSIGSTKRTRMVWPDSENSGIVYLIDLSKGLFRSNNGGQSWTNMWPSMSFKNNDFYNTGYIAVDDNDPTTLYVSFQGNNGSPVGTSFKVYRLTGADTRIFGLPGTTGIEDITYHTNNSLIKRPGPIVFGPNGKLWLTEQQNSPNSIDAGFYVMENPTTDATFTNLTSNEYKNIVTRPSGIDVSSDGYIYIVQNGTGLTKIKYIGDEVEGEDLILVSNDCIELLEEPDTDVYTVRGTLTAYDIDILYADESVHSTLDNSGTEVSIDTSTLPAGLFFVRVSRHGNSDLHLQTIIKE